MAQQWYHARGDRKAGPISSEQLRELVAAGSLQPTDLVWTEGMERWREARQVKGLFTTSGVGAGGGPPPVPPPPIRSAPRPRETGMPDDGQPNATNPAVSIKPLWVGTAIALFFPLGLYLLWKHPTLGRDKKWWGIGGAWSLLVFMAAIGGGKEKSSPAIARSVAASGRAVASSDDRDDAAGAAAAGNGGVALGEEFQLGDYKYNILSVDHRQSVGSNPFSRKTAGTGAVYVVVSYTIENRARESKTVMADDFVLLDSQDRKFQPSSEANTALLVDGGKDFLVSQLQPGIPRSMKTAFEVPLSSLGGGMTLIIPEKGFFGTGEVRVMLRGATSNEAPTTAPASQVAQDGEAKLDAFRNVVEVFHQFPDEYASEEERRQFNA